MVAAIAFESVVKLVAFVAVGVFVTFGIYNGFGDMFRPGRAGAEAEGADDGGGHRRQLRQLVVADLPVHAGHHVPAAAVPDRGGRERQRAAPGRAIWLFPLYLLLINIFVLPIAVGGLMHFPDGSVDADTFVLTLPMAEQQELLALLVFIGGLSAATGMVIVETIALSTMVCNDLVMPCCCAGSRCGCTRSRDDLSGLLLSIRRCAIAAILLLGYLYFRAAGEAYALVGIGLISFAAVAQFAPAIIGGIYWKGGTREGAIRRPGAGFAVWIYTLLLPSFAKSGWLDRWIS
jgi:Na+/proline symporter